jgi:tetratricopeptide (TPR) repeat protein
MRRASSSSAAALLGLALLAGWMLACERQDAGTATQEMPAGGVTAAQFSGRETCEPCHAREAGLWRGSHHDRAMELPDRSTVLGDFDGTTVTHFGVSSTFTTADDRFSVRTEGPDGELRDYEIAYTFGFYPLQQYLIETEGGRYQALGLAWDSRPEAEGGQRWFHLYPDERIEPGDRLHWTSPDQNWNFMCAECHSTDLQKRFQPDEDRYETSWAEIDVSCEACHGPGSAHVDWAVSVERGEIERQPVAAGREEVGLVVPLTEARDFAWIINPDTGIAQRNPPRRSHTEIEACARCHSRRSVLVEPYEYGRPLMDTHRPALLQDSLYYHDGQIREEVYVYGSFLQSRMYLQGVTCSDCHEPHSLSLHTDGNALCGRCHLAQKFDTRSHHFHEPGTSGAECVSCHMPETTYMVVDPRRDHSMRVPRPDLTVGIGVPNACNGCHTDQTVAWAAEIVARWYGPERRESAHYGEVFAAARSGEIDAADALARVVEDPTRAPIVRATAVELLAGYLRPSTLPVIRRALDHADPLMRAAAAASLEGLAPELRVETLPGLLSDRVRGVRLAAARALAGVPDSLLSASQSLALERALDEYAAAQRANAERPEAQLNLGWLSMQVGDFVAAEGAFRRALQMDPGLIAGYVNMADLYRAQGRDREGEALLLDALAIAPADGDLHYALGLLYVRQNRRQAAVEALRNAAELRPEMPRYSYAYGAALHASGESTRALAVLAEAHARMPGDQELLIGSITIAREAGEIDTAIDYAAKLVEMRPRDPEVRRLYEELLAERR